jgi:methyl-accepting chemotaxis protein
MKPELTPHGENGMKTNHSMSLQAKLRTLTIMTVVGLCVLFTVLLHNERNQLLSDRQDKVRNLVEVAAATVSHYEKQAAEGKLDVQTAQKLALDTLRDIRYNGSDYFWIHDLNDTMIMHPIKPELNGTNLAQNKDSNGKLLFVEMNKIIRADGAGFVEYVWPKPGFKDAVPKISYVKGTDVWHWVIGSGIYLNDVETLFWQNALKFLAWGLLIGGFISVSLILVGRNVLKAIGGDPQQALQAIHRITAGDLSTEVVCTSGDTGSVLSGIKEMQTTLLKMIEEIQQGAEQISAAAEQLMTSSEEVAKRSQQQSESASSIAAAVEEMTASIDRVSENAHEANNISLHASNLSQKGATVIQNAAVEMNKISEAVKSSSLIIEDLGHQSDQITSIVNTIREIADQTNLLALNAAIEAARAGEQGRGFAVVADEVRKLAERTTISTSEIASTVEKIQSGTRNAVGSMGSGVAQAGRGVELAGQAGASITEINDGATRVMGMVNSISESIREQSIASSDIAKSIEHIARMSEESSLEIQETANAARHLQQLSLTLRSSVSSFKLA